MVRVDHHPGDCVRGRQMAHIKSLRPMIRSISLLACISGVVALTVFPDAATAAGTSWGSKAYTNPNVSLQVGNLIVAMNSSLPASFVNGKGQTVSLAGLVVDVNSSGNVTGGSGVISLNPTATSTLTVVGGVTKTKELKVDATANGTELEFQIFNVNVTEETAPTPVPLGVQIDILLIA